MEPGKYMKLKETVERQALSSTLLKVFLFTRILSSDCPQTEYIDNYKENIEAF